MLYIREFLPLFELFVIFPIWFLEHYTDFYYQLNGITLTYITELLLLTRLSTTII